MDHFKGVNDRYVHDTGDLALKHIAGMLEKAGRKNDFGKLEILGFGRANSNGVQHGMVLNIDQTIKAIQQALESCRGNMSHAARTLGISRQTLYRKLALRKERLAAPDVQHSARGLLSGR